MSLLLLVLVSLFSCSKDADLLSEYVIASDNDLESIALLLDDSFFMAPGQDAIVMDVLNNDSFSPDAEVAIIGTSSPSNGDVTINEDNTLTYTPNTEEESTEEPVEDNFTYTTEVTTEDNTTYREEATVTISSSDMGELLAFPGAQGFGKYTTGGRGGKVIHVTNLNDSGSGSLRYALEQKGARTVVFDVGGDIHLTGMQLNIGASNGDLTIAGETAPFPGITIRGDNISSSSYGGVLNVLGSNIIIRYITVRENNNGRTKNDAIRLRNDNGMSNIILDHVTLGHSSDENLSIQGVSNVTIQNCMAQINYGSGNVIFGTYVYDASFVGNYLSHVGYRNVLLGYGEHDETIEFINNIIYGYEEGLYIAYGHNTDILGNIYKAFPDNTPNYASIQWVQNLNKMSVSDGDLYLSDNHQLNSHQYSLYNNQAIDYQSNNRAVSNSTITTWATTTQDIEARVFGDKLPGNSLYQDSMDEQAISDYFNNTGNFNSLKVPNKESSARSDNYDTDKDGMADAWERAMFGDLSKTANGDEDGDGYTNLEAFLYSLVQ
ncbi:Ig-like domain-containing protein [Maribacter thermophilus]|uniref:Ig-like domain-containing protein n=1 Tax=Maribacter thermophilus TaxID=1197874 RepID=UPI0012FC1E62|nr:Ig-like domain-containing protein [Maribacter thermophilus]